MTVKDFNNVYNIQTACISAACYNSILKRESGHANREIEIKTDLILEFLYLREIHKMNSLKLNHETLFLPY